jgi:nicotinate-nucleotide adenylyltransferase
VRDWHPGPTPQRIGIYGGTFDPVHQGHLVAATEVWSALRLDRLVFMPAGQPPHKRDLAISEAQHRVRMLELATAGRDHFALSTLDLAPDRPSYTADLLAHIRTAWGAAHELFFVMGEDSLRDFPRWHAPEQVAALAQLAVVTRPNVAVEVEAIVHAVPALAGRVHCIAIPQLDIASHDLRERVATGRPIAYQVPAEVEDYIAREDLYRMANDD